MKLRRVKEMKTLFPVGEENTAYEKYFIGKSYLQPLAQSLSVSNVTFEPGCRNNWHIHHKGGQILLVTDGRGWYQEWGKPARELLKIAGLLILRLLFLQKMLLMNG